MLLFWWLSVHKNMENELYPKVDTNRFKQIKTKWQHRHAGQPAGHFTAEEEEEHHRVRVTNNMQTR